MKYSFKTPRQSMGTIHTCACIEVRHAQMRPHAAYSGSQTAGWLLVPKCTEDGRAHVCNCSLSYPNTARDVIQGKGLTIDASLLARCVPPMLTTCKTIEHQLLRYKYSTWVPFCTPCRSSSLFSFISSNPQRNSADIATCGCTLSQFWRSRKLGNTCSDKATAAW